LTGADALDLSDIGYQAGTGASFAGNTNGGTLTVTDGSNAAHIALVGNYTTSGWTLSSDGNGGTTLVDPPLGSSSISQTMALLGQQIASSWTDTGSTGGGTFGHSETSVWSPAPANALTRSA
jgi:hypothetical protein